MGAWTNANDIKRRIKAGEFTEKSNTWRCNVRRVARLPEEMGAEIDRLGVAFSSALIVAEGATRENQQRRLDDLRARVEVGDLVGRRLAREHRTHRKMGHGINVHVPEDIVNSTAEDMHDFLLTTVQAIIEKRNRENGATAPAQSELAPEAAG